jgi:hypothetical protein
MKCAIRKTAHPGHYDSGSVEGFLPSVWSASLKVT